MSEPTPRRPEPRQRLDGYCIVCRKQKAILDAFCSTTCCRVYFETTLVVSSS